MKNNYLQIVLYFLLSFRVFGEDIEAIRTKTKLLQNEIEQTSKRKALIETEVAKIAIKIQKLTQEKKLAIKSQLKAQNLVKEKRKEIKEEEERVHSLLDSYKKDLLALYNSGYTENILESKSFSQIKIEDYIVYIIKSRQEKVDKLNKSIDKLERLKLERKNSEKELQTKLIEIEISEKQLKTNSQNQRALLANLARDLSSKKNKLIALKEDQERLAKLISKRVKLSKNQKLGPLQGKLRWPVTGKLTHRFGETRTDGFGTWKGIVIETQENSKVHAVQGGQIAYSGYLLGYGLVVVIAHEDGYATIYGHNNSLSVKSGEIVQENDIVAITGNTGSLDSSGLYFALSKEGKSKNPSRWLSP